MNATGPALIDFHTHYVHPGWTLPEPRGNTPAQKDLWSTIHRRIADEKALLESIEAGDLAGRVVNTPTALFAPEADDDTYRRINDQLAELSARHAGRIHALASVDVFAGEAAARELHRAVRELGLRGVFVDSAKGALLLDAPQARPVLRAAAELGVVVFVHPVNPEPLTTQLAPYGRLGTLLARGTVNSASLIALIEGGVFDELADLKVVVTALAIGGIVLASGFGAEFGRRPEIGAILRRHVHVDTMGFDPVLIRAAVDILGVDNVLAGSDWPIVSDGPISRAAENALTAAGLDAEARAKVGSLNGLRLLAPKPLN
ncbi:amidohydrolase family protein [Aquamicrobium sp. LC103]|uniref:amidohydrolase family protein n=1 Tax=Aquamicrobium sp. LC103 TaxID=1120658 RepID=UPI000699FF2F|nr:amidohydrolase family protein [Aquamicrobium sp. LC103]TKT76310.1 amidohydrolase 2 [Aquamicrobium sp. LC103]